MSSTEGVGRRDPVGVAGVVTGGLCVALAVVAIAFRGLGSGIRGGIDDNLYFVVDVVAGISYGAAGGAVATRLPRHRTGWLLLVVGIGHAIAAWSTGYWELSIRWPGLPALRTIGWLTSWTWRPSLMVLATVLLLTMPDGRLPSRRWRPLAQGAVGLIVLDLMVSFVNPNPWPAAAPRSPFGVRSTFLADVIGSREAWTFHAFRVLALASFVGLVVRRHRAASEERLALTWLVIGGAAVTTSVVLSDLPVISDHVPSSGTVFPLLQLVALPFLPLAGLIAVLRHRLLGLEIVVRRALLWVLLSGGTVAVYAGVVAIAGAVVSGSGTPAFVAAMVVGAGFHPARVRVQRAVDTLLYGQRRDPYGVVRDLGDRIQASAHPDEILPSICALLTESMRLHFAAIDSLETDGWHRLAARGEPGTDSIEVALHDRGEVIGRLIVGADRSDAIGGRDRRLVDDVAHQAALALATIRVSQQLQRSRELLVGSREEERRRLRRELHDEIGPSMAGVALGLKAAANDIERQGGDPSTRALLEQLVVELEGSVAMVRRMSYDLRPPALDDRGLVAALEDYVARHDGEGPAVVVLADGVPQHLPAAVEVAAYRISVEALANAARHGRATRCNVRIRYDHDLTVHVDDDGVGLPPSYRAGVGVTSMRERARELGGTCDLAMRPEGGTTVTAVIPLPDTAGRADG